MTKRLIILSEYFAPENAIASVRPTKLAKYLRRYHNLDITVGAKINQDAKIDESLISDFNELDKIIRCADGVVSKFIQHLITAKRKRNTSVLCNNIDNSNDKKQSQSPIAKNITNNLKFILQMVSTSEYANKMFRELKDKRCDYIFSSYGSFASHIIAVRLKKRYPDIYWIADFRDSVIYDTAPFLFRIYCSWFMKQVIKNCDFITAVSKGCLDSLGLLNKPSQVLYNGFDPEDLASLPAMSIHPIMTFGYYGQLYSGRRDFTIFFKAIRELITDKIIDDSDILFEYAGPHPQVFVDQARKYRLEANVINRGMVTRDIALKLESSCDVLMLASWNSVGNLGVVTGKFYEYMLMHKPIIAVVSGNISSSELSEMIEASGVGFCYEEAAHETDYPLLKAYLRQLITEHNMNGSVATNRRDDYIQQFSYVSLAKTLSDILDRGGNAN